MMRIDNHLFHLLSKGGTFRNSPIVFKVWIDQCFRMFKDMTMHHVETTCANSMFLFISIVHIPFYVPRMDESSE